MLLKDFATDSAAKPGLGSKTVVPSDAADLWPNECARQLVVLAAGDVCFVGVDGVEDTWTVTAAMVPFTIPVAMTRVKATGTTVASGNIKAIR